MADHIQDYYNNYDEDNRLTSRHGQVEFLTTMRYIEKRLFTGARILEIGAGTGRYSHALAKQGYSVDAVELVPHNIDIFNEKSTADEKISIRQGDARDLSAFADDTYDLTLILGPLYHMYTLEDKRRAISEALRVTRPGGVLFAAYCMADASILQYGFIGGYIHKLMESGGIQGDYVAMPGFKPISTPASVFEIVRKEDIDELMSEYAVERLHLAATDLYTNHMRGAVDAMDDATFDLYLQYHWFICERPDMFGLTHHSLDVFRKL